MATTNTTGKKVAVVTGSNRGIGLQIVKDLIQKLDLNYDVLLTARTEENGQKAVTQVLDAVKNTKANLKFHQLDIDDRKSIENLRNDLQTSYGGFDILVQNAGVMNRYDDKPIAEIAETTHKTNYWSVRDLCSTMLPIMRENGRIVMLASRLGDLSFVKSSDTRKRLLSDDLKLDDLDTIMKDYLEAAKAFTTNGRKNESMIWNDSAFKQPYGPYGVSKIGVIALGHVLQREVDAQSGAGKNILVASCCPGYVDTDLTEHKGHKTVEQGADTPVYLATLLNNNSSGSGALPKGQFVYERKVVDWATHRHEFLPVNQ